MTAIPNARRYVTASGLHDWGGTQYNTLEFTRPHSSMSANDRWTAAYPDLLWEVRAGVIGGVYPYLYELVNAPAGMTINDFTGKITATLSAGTYSNIQVRATDTKGTSVLSAAFTIVCATTRFRFFDAVNGNNAWNGLSPTFVSGTTGPKQTLAAWQGIGSSTLISYWLNGTYTNTGLTVHDDGARFIAASNESAIMLAYPGHSPLFDFEHNEGVFEATTWDFLGGGGGHPAVYLDGLEITRAGNKGIRLGTTNDNFVLWRCKGHDWGPGADGENSAFCDFESGAYGSGQLNYGVIQDNEFYDITQPPSGVQPNCVTKLYATYKLLIENNYLHDLTIQGDDEQAFANKAGNQRMTVRGNIGLNMGMGLFGGNMNMEGPTHTEWPCDFEFCFNYVQNDSDVCILINHDNNQNAASQIYRNTFRGHVVWDELDADNGPYTYTRNVTINGDAATDNPNGSGITFNIPPTAIGRLTVSSESVFGNEAAGIVDADGKLTGASRALYYPNYGYEVPEAA